jgi:hypothetical protein
MQSVRERRVDRAVLVWRIVRPASGMAPDEGLMKRGKVLIFF